MVQYQRSGHYLKRNAAVCLPRYIIAVDTETIPHDDPDNKNKLWHKLRLGCAIAGRYEKNKITRRKDLTFTTAGEFWDFAYDFTGKRHTVWIVAHNALFDLTILNIADELIQSRLTTDSPRSKRRRDDNSADNPHCYGIVAVDPPPLIIGLVACETMGRIVCLDTLNWFPHKLSVLGNHLGIEKLPMPSFNAPDSEWIEYCQIDTEIVFQTFVSLINWTREQNIGMFRYTAAAQSMSAYRHRFMGVQPVIHDNMDVKKMERRAYFGGRTEVFKLGPIKKIVWQVDVNSLFPWIMKCSPVPISLQRYDLGIDYLEILPELRWSDCVADVKIRTTKPLYPCRIDKRVYWPTGTFYTSLCGEELALARNNGHIVGIKSWAEYKTGIIFSEYVNYFWQLRMHYRQIGDKLLEQFAKQFLVSLYGKFGQKAPAWELCDNNYCMRPFESLVRHDYSTGTRECYRMFGWQCQHTVSDREIKSSFVAIAGFITAAARRHMDRLRQIAGVDHCFYQGIDSLLIDSQGFDNLEKADRISQQELGMLREVADGSDCCIFGCADYALGKRLIIAGRPSDVIDTEMEGFLVRKFATAQALWGVQPRNEIEQSIQPWVRSKEYAKGVMGEDHWIHPHEFAVANGQNQLLSVGTASAASAKESAVSM